jgi:hypothetical protein
MNWIQQNFRKIVYVSFLIPIILVALVSISHVTKWYGISNPFSWAIYLSVAVEVAALSALAAISAKMGKKVYLPFGIVTLIQFIGNIFFAYQYIDINSVTFKDWVDLVDPLVSYLGVESGNMIAHKRFLALFAGGMLPLISLSFLHMLVKFEEEDKKEEKFSIKEEVKPEEPQIFSTNEPIVENIFHNNEYDLEEQPPIIQNFEHTIEMEPLPFWNDLIEEPIIDEIVEESQHVEDANDDVLIEEVQDSKDDNDRVSLEDLDEVEETSVETVYPIIPPVINPLPQIQPTQPKRLNYIKRI